MDGIQTSVHDVKELIDNFGDGLDVVTKKFIIKHSLLSICYVHEHNIRHGDIKSANFFVGDTRNGIVVKLGDFSEAVSRTLTQTSSKQERSVAGTLTFTPPEAFQKQNLTLKSDIYSLGMFLVEPLIPSWEHPWSEDAQAPALIPSLVVDSKRPSLRESGIAFSKLLNQMIRKCLPQIPSDCADAKALMCRGVEVKLGKRD